MDCTIIFLCAAMVEMGKKRKKESNPSVYGKYSQSRMETKYHLFMENTI